MKMGCVVVGFASVCLFVLVSAGALRADDLPVVINEVLYDPVGADGGYEYVEIFNGSGGALSLEGWTFETGNGGYPDRWTLEWTGSKSDTIRAGGFFVIGEDMVIPEPDFKTGLDLQNGPDGCRLTDPAGAVDVVGWGDLGYGEYFEGEPAGDAGSGSSVGRDPDGRDSGFNGKDFVAFAVPSPADFNRPPTDLTLTAVGLSRYTPPATLEIDLMCRIQNLGTEPCGKEAVLAAEAGGLCDKVLIPDDLAPSETLGMVLRFPNPGTGIHGVTVWLSHALDRWNGNDTLRTSVVIPPPPIVINEIMFKPDGQDCEWIELFNHSDFALSLSGWTLADSRGRPESIAEDDVAVPAGGFLVLVEDEDVFEAIHPGVPGNLFRRPSGGWPTLNDVDGPLRFADAVVIRDAFGTMVDSVAYSRSWAAPGRSVERIDPRAPSPSAANWSPHFGETPSSPGTPNSVSFHLPAEGRVLSLSTRIFSPDGDGRDDLAAVSLSLPGPGLVRLSVFDVNGRVVRRLIDGEIVDSGRVTFWDGSRDDDSRASTGVYLLLMEARMQTSDQVFRAKSPLVLIRR